MRGYNGQRARQILQEDKRTRWFTVPLSWNSQRDLKRCTTWCCSTASQANPNGWTSNHIKAFADDREIPQPYADDHEFAACSAVMRVSVIVYAVRGTPEKVYPATGITAISSRYTSTDVSNIIPTSLIYKRGHTRKPIFVVNFISNAPGCSQYQSLKLLKN